MVAALYTGIKGGDAFRHKAARTAGGLFSKLYELDGGKISAADPFIEFMEGDGTIFRGIKTFNIRGCRAEQ